MKLGLKCDGCRMWTLIDPYKLKWIGGWHPRDPYYCDECLANVSWRESKARISWER